MPCTRFAGFAAALVANVFLLTGGCGNEVVSHSGEAGSAGEQQAAGEGGGGKGGAQGDGGQPEHCPNGRSRVCTCTCGEREVAVEGCWEESCSDLDGQLCDYSMYKFCHLAAEQPGGCCY